MEGPWTLKHEGKWSQKFLYGIRFSDTLHEIPFKRSAHNNSPKRLHEKGTEDLQSKLCLIKKISFRDSVYDLNSYSLTLKINSRSEISNTSHGEARQLPFAVLCAFQQSSSWNQRQSKKRTHLVPGLDWLTIESNPQKSSRHGDTPALGFSSIEPMGHKTQTRTRITHVPRLGHLYQHKSVYFKHQYANNHTSKNVSIQ